MSARVAAGGFGNVARAFASRDYRLYASGNAVSLVGSWMQRVAVGWLGWQLTHSGTWLGLLAFADLFPTVLLSPVAGSVADRYDKIRVIWATQIIAMTQALLLALLTWQGMITIWSLFGLACLLGASNAFNQPARLALIPNLVDRTTLPSAVAINSVIFNSARFLGPALSGIIIAAGSISLAFAINGASYLAVMAALASLSLKRAPPEGARRRNILATTVDGYRYAARHHGIGSLLLLMAVTSVCLRGFIELLPGFTDAVFHRGPQALAWLTAITGLGAVVGGLWMVRRPALAGLTAVVVANTLVMAAALFCFTLTAYFWLALPCLFVAGFGLVVTGIGAQTLVQTAVEPAMRGRIMALYGTIFRGGPAVCALVMGTLSSSFGMRAPLAAGAVLCAACWAWARLRQEGVARELESLPA